MFKSVPDRQIAQVSNCITLLGRVSDGFRRLVAEHGPESVAVLSTGQLVQLKAIGVERKGRR